MSVIVFFYCQFYWLRDALTEPWPIVTEANLFATDGHTDYRTYPLSIARFDKILIICECS